MRASAKRGTRVLGSLGLAVLAGGLIFSGLTAVPAPAQALDLPTWDDVQAAKKNQASADKKVAEIKSLIADGEEELDRRRNLHASTIEELNQAEEALAEAAERASTLNTQAKKSRKEADEAAERAGVLVAQMYRSGGVDRSMDLFLESDASTADALLERLASMSKATERNTSLAEDAEQTANTASTLTKQAKAAEDEREVLRQDKKDKETAAATAVTEQGVLVQEQEAQQRDLEAKLAALEDKTTKTVDGYQERLRIEEEQRRKAAEEARKAAEAERKRQEEEARRQQEQQNNNNNNNNNNSNDDTVSPPPTSPPVAPPTSNPGTSNGWTYPTSGYYVSEGFRPPGRPDHTGIDLATGMGTPIVAADAGQVALTYWDPCGGNMVSINHPNGWQTRYAHMNSWAIVTPGQHVAAGQTVGYVGSTGCSTGPHLHFEMRPNQDNGWYDFVNPAFYIGF